MTLVYRRASPGHHCRTLQEELLVAADAATGRVLHHQRVAADRRVQIPIEVFQVSRVCLPTNFVHMLDT